MDKRMTIQQLYGDIGDRSTNEVGTEERKKQSS